MENDIKIVLFQNTYENAIKWHKAKMEYGDWEWFTDMYRHKFEALYTVIEECGLELEYQKYKETRMLEDAKLKEVV